MSKRSERETTETTELNMERARAEAEDRRRNAPITMGQLEDAIRYLRTYDQVSAEIADALCKLVEVLNFI